jgi:hypothetical protein
MATFVAVVTAAAVVSAALLPRKLRREMVIFPTPLSLC